ncbi:hypothetical protein ACLB1M_09015 [Escherichia coli]
MAHADIAPQRKDDPGPLFPWQQLAQQGIGAWPDAQRVNFYLAGRAPHTPVDTASLLELLARYGYDVKPDMTPREQRRVIMAFQMHFRPTLYASCTQKLRRLPKHCWRNTGRISAAVFRGRVARRQFSRYLHPG